MSSERINDEDRMDVLEGKLNDLLEVLGERNGRGKRKRSRDDEEDGPRSVHDLQVRRKGDPMEIQGVLMPVKVSVGRHGDSISGYVLLPPVRDERELEEVADEFEREFRSARVYQQREERGGNGYGNRYQNGGGYRNGNSYGGSYNGGGYRNNYQNGGGYRRDYGRDNYRRDRW